MHAPVATIDIGTNTILLLVARKTADGVLEVLDDRCVTARLGEGLVPGGTLAPHAVQRATQVVHDLLDRAHELGVRIEDVWAAGTAVLRRATDAASFLEGVRARTGLLIEVLSEEDEGRIGFLAVTADGAAQDTWIVDVGGGSTEVVGQRGELRRSAPVGAVTLGAEQRAAGGLAGNDEASFERLLAAARAACASFPTGAVSRSSEVVCLGGTASNLACLDLGLAGFDHERAEGHTLGAASALREARRLWPLSLADRRALPIEADRAEILPAGLACLAAALERIGAGQIRVSGRGLRYGMARERLA